MGVVLKGRIGWPRQLLDGVTAPPNFGLGGDGAANGRTAAEEIGEGADYMTPEQQRKVLLGVVEGITVDRHNDVNITLAVPIDDSLPVEAPSPQPCDRLEAL